MSASGGSRVDLHVKILDDAVVRRAKAAGLDVLVYAPHFTHLETVRERAARYSDDDLLVVPARECFTGPWHDRRHVLAVDPDAPVPDFIPLSDTMDELDRQDAAVLAPHPAFLSVSLSGADVAAYRDVVDAVETFCPKHWWWHNRRARGIADEAGLPRYTSSYAHLRPTVGTAWVTFDEPVSTAAELTDAIERGAPRELHHERGPSALLKYKTEFAHLGWENSWDKFERVVLSGRAATHPLDPRYDGRFEELSVY